MSGGERKGARALSGLDVALVVVTNVAIFVEIYAVLGLFGYRAGRQNESLPIVLPVLVGFVAMIGLCVTLWRAVWALVRWHGTPTGTKAFRLAGVAITIGVAATSFVLPSPGGYLDGLRDYILAQTSVDEIRQWGRAHPGFQERAAICGLREGSVRVAPDGYEIYIHWGGGFRTSRSLLVQPPHEQRPLGSNVLEVAPGAFVSMSVN